VQRLDWEAGEKGQGTGEGRRKEKGARSLRDKKDMRRGRKGSVPCATPPTEGQASRAYFRNHNSKFHHERGHIALHYFSFNDGQRMKLNSFYQVCSFLQKRLPACLPVPSPFATHTLLTCVRFQARQGMLRSGKIRNDADVVLSTVMTGFDDFVKHKLGYCESGSLHPDPIHSILGQ